MLIAASIFQGVFLVINHTRLSVIKTYFSKIDFLIYIKGALVNSYRYMINISTHCSNKQQFFLCLFSLSLSIFSILFLILFAHQNLDHIQRRQSVTRGTLFFQKQNACIDIKKSFLSRYLSETLL